MSQNQLRGDKKELQYRKTGVVVGSKHNTGSDFQQRPLSGGSGSGTASSLSSNPSAGRSFKKPNNGNVGQSRGNSGPVNSSSDPNTTTGARPVENGSHVQSTVSGASHKPAPAVVSKPAEASNQKSSQPVPKVTSSQTASMTSDSTLPATPSKGDAGKGFSLQFGSISPGFMNVMQVPARTSSAPPNLDEQQRNQALRMASKASPASPAPSSAPKHSIPNSDAPTEKPTPQEPRTISVVTCAAPPIQAQKPSVIPVAGISMPMQFTQPTGPVQFGGPNAQIPSQGIRPNSHPMPMQMPLPMGNPTQVQQPVFVPGLQHHHLMPNQGILHQGPNFGFNPPMAHQLPHQPRNLGMNMSPQVNQQAGHFGSARKTVKITHPDTHEELRLDDKNGGSPSSRVNHIAHPQSQPIPPYTAARPGGFYTNSYTSGSPFIPPPSSLPLTSNSLAPRFNYPGQGAPVMPYVNQAASASPSVNVGGVSVPGRPESLNLDSTRGAPHVRPSTYSPPTSVPVTIKPAVAPAGNSNAIEKGDSVSVSASAADAGVGSKESKVNAASSSPPLKSHDSSKQSDVAVPTSTSVSTDASKETDVNSNPLRGAPELSGQKGYPQKSSQENVNLSKVANSESAAAKGTPSSPRSKVGVVDVVPGSSVDASASHHGIEDKSTIDHPAGVKDSHLQSVTKPGETEHSGGLQLNDPLKATSAVFRPEPPSSEPKKSDHEAGVLEASEAEAATDNHLGTNVKDEAEIIDNARPSSSSGVASGTSKPSGELIKTKNSKGKKKSKEMFRKAESLGTNPDLYMAYKVPKENKETVVVEESVHDHITKEMSGATPENAVKKTDEQSKPELENWEDVADGSTPKLKSSDNVKRGVFYQEDDGAAVKKYTRDFLLTISEQCTDLPEGFQISPNIVEILVHSKSNDSRGHSNTGRINDRSSGAARHDRRGNGNMDTDKWAKPTPHISRGDPGEQTNMIGFRPGQGANYAVRPRGPGLVQHGVGIVPGLTLSTSFQTPHRNILDADRWHRATSFNKGLMPSPQTQPVMHRAEKKYEVGKVSDEEQAKQRRLKAILNKLTPQNFEKLFEQVKEVNIDNVITLTGVISQIFDKALMEPTFCEMYSNFCQHLASELPELSVDNQKITFRRLLLNKCQEEFERGEREEEEVNKDEGETKQTEQEKEEKRLQVRRRMLGNIRLIGELYKKRMLTERIMHECIKKLLGNYQNADEENIEALCKLMSTIGEMIDHPKAKEHMDAYFDIMRQLSNDMKLSSRVRFMLRDTIDLRKNRWQQRRKVEGPKKIEEVHRAAAQERLGQGSRLTRGPSMNSATRRGPPLEYAPRNSVLSSPVSQGGGYRGVGPQFRGFAGQDSRVDDKSEFENRTLSVPLLPRSSGDEHIMLGPQGGLAKKMSTIRQPSVSSGPTVDNSSSHADARREVGGLNGYSSRGDQFSKQAVPSANAYTSNQAGNSNATQKVSSEKVYPEERLREMSMAAIKEYYSAKDVKEAELCIKELNAPSFYPTLISMWVSDAFERKDMERNVLAKLLVSLTKSQDSIFSQQQLIEGFESLLTVFEDTVTDAPKAPEFLGRIFGTLILENVLPLQDVCRLIHQGGEEPGRLLEVGLAADVLGSILEMIKAEKGDATLNELRTSSNLRLEDYLPPEPHKSRKLEMFL
ncbi:hypothetical protein vseg_004346 [Gypsophila vaccaria]